MIDLKRRLQCARLKVVGAVLWCFYLPPYFFYFFFFFLFVAVEREKRLSHCAVRLRKKIVKANFNGGCEG